MANIKTQHDECECPVCQEDYDDPKLLCCGHIICRQCVLSWLETRGKQNGCPLCRAAIFPLGKDGSKSPELATLINSLPTDAAAISMVECKQLLKGRHICCVCDDNTSASTVCMDCNIKLCQSCSKSHRKVPALREHVLEELATLTPERLAALRKSSCDVHKERPAELYCPTHQSLVCVLCSSSTHRSCHDVTVLSDFANSERQTLKSQCERLRKIKTSLEEQMILLEQKIRDVQTQTNSKKNEVKVMCDRLKQSVDRHCQDIQARLEANTEVIVSKVNTEKSALKAHLASVAAHVFVADRLLTTAAEGSLVKTLPNVKTSLSALECQNIVLSPFREHVVHFDSEMLNCLKTAVDEFERTVVTFSKMKVKKCQVLYDYKPKEIDELELKTGSIVEFHEEVEEGWFYGSSCGKIGLFPSNFVKVLEHDEGNKAEDVSLQTEGRNMSTLLIPEDTLNDIKMRLIEMLHMPESNVCQIKECMEELKYLYYKHHVQRKALVDAANDHGYAILFVKLLKKLNTMESDDVIWSLAQISYSVLWNYSDASEKMAKRLADAGIISILTSNLRCKQYLQALADKNVYYLLEASLSTLHNIARWPGVTHYLDKCKTSEAMKPFLIMDGAKYGTVKTIATLTAAYIGYKRIADKDVINSIVSWLENALKSSNHIYQRIPTFELAQALAKLADNDTNTLQILEAGALPHFLKLLQQKDARDQAMGAHCLWAISFNSKVKQKIIENKLLIETLETLTESTCPDVRVNAALALWAINGDGVF